MGGANVFDFSKIVLDLNKKQKNVAPPPINIQTNITRYSKNSNKATENLRFIIINFHLTN